MTPPVQCGWQLQLPPFLYFCILGSVHSRSCQCRKWLSSPSLGWKLQGRFLGLYAESECLQDNKQINKLSKTKRFVSFLSPVCLLSFCRSSPGSMLSKLDLASGWRNSDLGVNTISWSSRDKENERLGFTTCKAISWLRSHLHAAALTGFLKGKRICLRRTWK